MAIKEVKDIRVNGKSWRNCNGKPLNSLTVNGTTYKLVKNYYTITFKGVVGKEPTSSYEVGDIPEGSNVTFEYSLGGNTIRVLLDGTFYQNVNLDRGEYKVLMGLSLEKIDNITANTEVTCKWANEAGEIYLNQEVYYQEGQEEARICTVNLTLDGHDNIHSAVDEANLQVSDSKGILSKSGSTWTTQVLPVNDFLMVEFKYLENGTYYSVFINNVCYDLRGTRKQYYPIEGLPPQNQTLTLTIVDNSWL